MTTTPTTNNDYAAHVNSLADAFGVRLDVQPLMPPELAGSGFRIIICPQCEQKNRLHRAGTVRCGRCKFALGTHNRIFSIMIAPVIDDETYCIALHELGHALHPTGRVNDWEGSKTWQATREVGTLRDMRLQLLEEESAWEWAQANALAWTERMQAIKIVALSTYRAHARHLGLDDRGNLLRRRTS